MVRDRAAVLGHAAVGGCQAVWSHDSLLLIQYQHEIFINAGAAGRLWNSYAGAKSDAVLVLQTCIVQ